MLATNPAYRELFAMDPARTALRNVLWTLFVLPEPDCPVVFREAELPLMGTSPSCGRAAMSCRPGRG